MVTIRDIAKKAEVSVATVSRIINNKGAASAETIARVNKIIEEMNYKPNSIAKSLSKKKSNLIALLIPTLNNPFFPELVREIEMAANQMGFQVYLCNSDDNREKVEYYLEAMADNYVAGAIINSLKVTAEDLHTLEKSGIPIITIDRASFEHPYSSISVSHRIGAAKAAAHLLHDSKHQNIVFISGPKEEKSSLDRLNGLNDVLDKYEKPLNLNVVYGDFEMDSGYQAIKSLLERGQKVDCIFSSNDAMAFGAMRACKENGLRIPEDLRIIGYDNTVFSAYSSPLLSTVDQRKDEIGQIAIKELFRLINSKEDAKETERKQFFLEPELIVRQSTL
ncbi:LacI family DNA-binding transcriptional regulator [Oceanobacillus oncorhynchi subsp. oncorhynchi]|uniref:LacI family DNA-binding transcriptional regulator n=1 Tax=Oceanobacillus oncorhynchi TaxID=545501 RepID=UPI00363B19B4